MPSKTRTFVKTEFGYRPSMAKKKVVIVKKTRRRAAPRYNRGKFSPEKKIYTATAPDDQKVGQLNGNSNGFYIADATPIPVQGPESNERIGTKIAVCSGHWDIQFSQQSSGATAMKGIIEVFYVETPGPLSMTDIYDATPFVKSGGISAGIIDYNSTRDVAAMRRFKRICFKKFYMKADNYSTALNILTIKMGFKRKRKPLIFRLSDSANTERYGQLIMTIRTDSGNWSGGASTLTGVPVTTAATGLIMNYQHMSYYYDS